MSRRLFTSESVTEGHPDKIADQISDSILDALLKDDPASRVAVETLITTGLVHVAGEVTTWSIVRGAWEVRLVRVDGIEADAAPTALRIGGWPIAADAVSHEAAGDRASAAAGGRHSTLVALTPGGAPAVEIRRDASPLGHEAAVPVVVFDVDPGVWRGCAVHLSDRPAASAPALSVDAADVSVTWPDLTVTRHRLA